MSTEKKCIWSITDGVNYEWRTGAVGDLYCPESHPSGVFSAIVHNVNSGGRHTGHYTYEFYDNANFIHVTKLYEINHVQFKTVYLGSLLRTIMKDIDLKELFNGAQSVYTGTCQCSADEYRNRPFEITIKSQQ